MNGTNPGYAWYGRGDENGLQRITGSRISTGDEKTDQMDANNVTMLQENIV